MAISEPSKAEKHLHRIGYYRLTAYWFPFFTFDHAGNRTDEFAEGTTFDTVAELYVFDKRLRLLSLDALERIEVALRTDVALILGEKGAFSYRNPESFDGKFSKVPDKKSKKIKHIEWLSRFEAVASRSKEEFVKHHWAKYKMSPLPIWKAVELFDFGMLSVLFSGLRFEDRNAVAERYGLPNGEILASWLRTLNFVRNVSAHHSRLWNKNLSDYPQMPKAGEIPVLDHLIEDKHSIGRYYAAACIMQKLLRTVNPSTTWAHRLSEHLTTFPESEIISLRAAGFQDGWAEQVLWAERP